jgi:hypothetical protein
VNIHINANSNTVNPCIAQAEQFIELLTGSKVMGGSKSTPVHIRFIDDRKHRGFPERGPPDYRLNYFGTIAELWSIILARQADGWGVGVVVNAGGTKSEQITKINANFIDSDGKPRPADGEWHHPPSFAVLRNEAHWHAYWTVNDQPVDMFKSRQEQLAELYGTDRSMSDLPQVMRLAGTLWLKGEQPQLYRLVFDQPWMRESWYGPMTPDEVDACVPPVQLKPKTTTKTNFDWALPVAGVVLRAFANGEARAFLDDGKWTDRSIGAFAFIGECKRRGYTPQTTADLMLEHSDTGVMGHYGDDKGRLRDDIARTWSKIEVEKSWLDEMNAKYAVAVRSGQCSIAVLDRSKIEFMRVEDFHRIHANKFVMVNDEKLPISKVWFKHEGRREYLNPGVVFEPGAPDHPGALNLWRGWAIAPVKGDWSLFRAHLLNVVCRGNQAQYDYLIRYFALGVQQPSRAIGVALAFLGRQGAGKGIVVRTYGQLFGVHFRHYSRAEQLLGRFNGNLGAACVVFLDEALFAASKQHEQILKALITEPTIEIEEKFVMPITVKNHLRVLISSNCDWVVPVAVDDRRFGVFDVADTYTPASEHKQYWKTLHKEIENGGQAAFLYDLLNLELNGFDVRDIPNTEARSAQKRHSLAGPHRWVYDVLSTDRIKTGYQDEVGWKKTGLEITMDDAYEDYCRASKRYGEHHPANREVWAKAIYEALGDTLKRTRPRDNLSRVSKLIFASCDRCRAAFQTNLKLTGTLWENEE